MITVLTVETSGLGDRSYLAHDGVVALVVDSQRDHDRMLAAAEQAGVQITHVFESHIHNDYVTGGYQLARAVGAQLRAQRRRSRRVRTRRSAGR